jgi:hypothetical protein
MAGQIPPTPSAEEKALTASRRAGNVRNGRVFVRNFDEGLVETMGACIIENNYFLLIDGVSGAPGLPGVPVTFAYPEDVFENYRIPVVVVRRDDIYPSMQRWHPGAQDYRVPAPGASPVTVTFPDGSQKQGFDKYETQYQAMPFDIMYTISIMARDRGSGGQRNQANLILQRVLRTYPPYGLVTVKDELGERRTYEAFSEGVGMLDSVPEIGSRFIGFAVTVRIEGELDLADPVESPAVTTIPKTNYQVKTIKLTP